MNDNNVHLIINNQYDELSIERVQLLKKPPHPQKIVNLNDEIEVLILDIDDDKKNKLQLKAN